MRFSSTEPGEMPLALGGAANSTWGSRHRHRGKRRGLEENGWLPSGKRLHSYGKSPFFMGKSTINSHFQ